MSTAGRTDYASYHDQFAGCVELSEREEQWLTDRITELAGQAFDQQSPSVRNWILDSAGDGDLCSQVLLAAIYESTADLREFVEHLRDLYINEHIDEFYDLAREELRTETGA